MSEHNAKLATQIGSRICHDLISPVGAITNGIELLEMTGGMEGPELELISDSVHNAGARIRFFRIAFGMASDQMLGRLEVTSVLKDVSRGARLQYDWQPEGAHPRAMVRMEFLALQCCETFMPYGGTVRVAYSDDQWTITGEADKLNIDPMLWSLLSGVTSSTTITPAQVQFMLLPAAAQAEGRRIEASHDGGSMALRF